MSNATWTDDELDRIGRADELDVAPQRPDGSIRRFTTVWVVQVDDDLIVRSWNGPNGAWYRAAHASGTARIRVAGIERDVTLEPATVDRNRVDAAYRAKYGSSRYVDAMTADGPAATTLQLLPR